jgi:NADH-quinone oxidoreductase subunit L
MVFFGDERWREPAEEDHHEHPEPHESPWTMTLPLVVLAGLSIVGGLINLPFTDDLKILEHWLEPVVHENEAVLDVATATKVGLALIAVLAALVGIFLGARVYLQRRMKAVEPEVLEQGWYYDRAITDFMGGPGREGFEAVATFDRVVVDGAVNGVAAAVSGSGGGLRRLQTGFVRSYALGVGIGAVGLLVYFLTRGGL